MTRLTLLLLAANALLGCSGSEPASESGWVNLAVGAGALRASASFVKEPQLCQVDEVADCVVTRCVAPRPELRVDAGVVRVVSGGLDLELNTDPSLSAEPSAYASSEVEHALLPAESLEFSLSGSASMPATSATLTVPEAVAVEPCTSWTEAGPVRVTPGADVTLSWTGATSGIVLVRLVPAGVDLPEPHVRAELSAICQYSAEQAGAVVRGAVTEFLGVPQVELHVDLVALQVIELDARVVAFSASRDVCQGG